MNATYIINIFSVFLFALLISCDNGKETEDESLDSPRIRKHSKILSPKKNASYTLGEDIKFSVSSDRQIDSVLLEYEDDTTYITNEFEWNSAKAKTGIQKLKLTIYSAGEPETHYPQIKLLSDMIPVEYTYRVLDVLPHDKTAYTQGLFFKDDTLYESTGPYLEYDGPKVQSRICKVNLKTGQPYKATPIDTRYFGEGSTHWQDQIFMLTWTSQTGFIFNEKLNQTGTFRYTHEGWGMTTKGDTLIVSDGSEILHLINPRDFSEFGKLQVYTNKGKVLNLNELEMIEGLLYANVYQDEAIAVIDPKSGKVLRYIQMSGLLSNSEAKTSDVLNGIAHNPLSDKTYVTGKLWPKMFEVEFVPAN